MATPPTLKPWYRVLYLQVLIAVALGITAGYFFPDFGRSLKPLGDGFIKLVMMMIAPIYLLQGDRPDHCNGQFFTWYNTEHYHSDIDIT